MGADADERSRHVTAEERLGRARKVLAEQGVDALLLGASPDLAWMTGYHALPLERLTMLVVPAAGDPVLIVPELERPRAEASGAPDAVEVADWAEDEDPVAAVVAALAAADGGGDATLAVDDRLWAVFLVRLQEALPAARWVEGGTVTRELRLRKEPDEVDRLRAAGAAIDAVHEAIPGMLRPGRTEREVARAIAEAILEDHDEVNFVIVAAGPNGASPHHETSDRPIATGEPIVIDIGGTRAGYCSDMTRNYVLGVAPADYREIHDVVEEAQRAGVEAVAAGVPAEEVDAVCRGIIADAGYGDRFIHRTGHGIGIEAHEHPYLVRGNDEPLEVGMAFSVEPGIYVPGRYGARVEDIVVVTADGAERLNRLERGLVEVEA
jgi:Xaa-Pro aminopeptidase